MPTVGIYPSIRPFYAIIGRIAVNKSLKGMNELQLSVKIFRDVTYSSFPYSKLTLSVILLNL